ncbi:MAG TPA: nucleotidyltransferase family protein [Bacteroidales bacterium]|nr:nucleotidyltransferase family protein [Bacteroidales bacterium]
MTTSENEKDQVITLLLLLSKTTFTEEERVLAEKGCRTLTGWKLFSDLVIRHGVAALVWQNITDLGLAESVPDQERSLLENIRFKTIARVSYITSEAAEVVAELEKEGIRALLLKGLALEHSVYGSRGLRQMSDADLLVAPEDALRAQKILVKAGFVSRPVKSSLYRHIILDLGNHLPELHRNGISVDMHHRLFGPEGAEIVKRALEKPETISISGRTYYVLPPGIALLGLVSHIFKHEVKGEFQLRLYTDIYLLVKKDGGKIFNGSLLSDADRTGISGGLRTVLTILNKFYEIDIPPEYNALAGTEQEKVAAFRDNLLDPGQAKPLSQKDIFLENLRSLRGIRRKLIFITGDLFPSLKFMKNRYGCNTALSALLYYPHRLGKILWVINPILPKYLQK